MTTYYDQHREDMKASHSAYYQQHKEEMQISHKAYKQTNKEKVDAYNKAYYNANKERMTKKYDDNKELILLQQKEYYQTNKDKYKAYQQKHKDRYKAYRYAKRYNLTITEWDTLYTSQNGLCGICHNPLIGKIVVDHCHKTGTIRGLLCHKCNVGLGMFNDDIDSLNNAMQYIQQYQCNP